MLTVPRRKFTNRYCPTVWHRKRLRKQLTTSSWGPVPLLKLLDKVGVEAVVTALPIASPEKERDRVIQAFRTAIVWSLHRLPTHPVIPVLTDPAYPLRLLSNGAATFPETNHEWQEGVLRRLLKILPAIEGC